MAFGRKLCLRCEYFPALLRKGESTTDYAADLFEGLHDIHPYARQNLKLASDRI
jgi:hypothetical protein